MDRPGSGLQERLESTPCGRTAITAFLVVTLACILVANLPEGQVQRRGVAIAQPYLNATGLGQRWRIFAPYPRRDVVYLEARVRHSDGRASIWRPPRNGPLVGGYRDYRWRKFVEHVVPAAVGVEPRSRLRPLTARFAARQSRLGGTRPVLVTLVVRTARVLPPDPRLPSRTPFRDQAYYTLRLDPRAVHERPAR